MAVSLMTPLIGMYEEADNMRLRFSIMGIIFWALGGLLLAYRGFHWNYVIPIVVGTVLFLYGVFGR